MVLGGFFHTDFGACLYIQIINYLLSFGATPNQHWNKNNNSEQFLYCEGVNELSQFWDFLRFGTNFERFRDRFQLGFSTCLYPCLISFSLGIGRVNGLLILFPTSSVRAAGNNYSIYHLLRFSIITGAGYWFLEFNKFRPTRRHSNKKDKKRDIF